MSREGAVLRFSFAGSPTAALALVQAVLAAALIDALVVAIRQGDESVVEVRFDEEA